MMIPVGGHWWVAPFLTANNKEPKGILWGPCRHFVSHLLVRQMWLRLLDNGLTACSIRTHVLVLWQSGSITVVAAHMLQRSGEDAPQCECMTIGPTCVQSCCQQGNSCLLRSFARRCLSNFMTGACCHTGTMAFAPQARQH